MVEERKDEEQKEEFPFVTSDQVEELSPEILEAFQDQFPGMKILCAGDMNPEDMPPQMVEAMEQFRNEQIQAFSEFRCTDCNVQMENRPQSEGDWDSWEPPEGWTWFNDPEGNPMMWQCPKCDEADQEGPEVKMIQIGAEDEPVTGKSTLLGFQYRFIGYMYMSDGNDGFAQFTFFHQQSDDGRYLICLSEVTAEDKEFFSPTLKNELGNLVEADEVIPYVQRGLDDVDFDTFKEIIEESYVNEEKVWMDG